MATLQLPRIPFPGLGFFRRANATRNRALVERLAEPLDDLAEFLFEQTQAGAVILDRSGRIVRANSVLRTMLGDAGKTLSGRALATLFHPTRLDDAWEELLPVLRGRRQPRPFVSALRVGEAEEELPVKVLPVALREPDGSVSGVILHLADLTAQQQLEAQLAHGQKLQAVGQLAGGIAHDFNNLLTAIIGASDEVLAQSGLSPDALRDVQQIRDSAGRGADLVRHLLAFGRQQTLQPRVVAINDAISKLSGLLGRLLGSSVRLDLELEEPGRTVRVDPTQLDQVLVNLAVNARDAMPEGGALRIRTSHASLFRPVVRGQETIPPGRYVCIEVEDTGSGIQPEVLPRIFDPFFTTKRERGGNGLGLSTVHGILRQSDGYVAVESVVGKGTTVKLFLPRHDGTAVTIPAVPDAAGREAAVHAARPEEASTVQPTVPAVAEPAAVAADADVQGQPAWTETPGGAPAASPPASAAPDDAGPTETPPARVVLLVDDEDPVRRLAERALSNKGWQVLAAESGEAALELLRTDPRAQGLTLVVSDVVMPGLDGPGVVREVRRLYPGLPAILASGYAEEALRREALADEGVRFLPKPYTLRELAAAAEEMVRESVA